MSDIDWCDLRTTEPFTVRRGRMYEDDPEPTLPFVVERHPHRCDERCVCPVDGLTLLYSPTMGLHACQDPDCENAHPESPPRNLPQRKPEETI